MKKFETIQEKSMNCKNSLDENEKNVYHDSMMWLYAKPEGGKLSG